MNLQQIQHAADLIGTSDPSKISGNENSIISSRNLLNVVGSLEVLAMNLKEYNFESTTEAFEKLAEFIYPSKMPEDGPESPDDQLESEG